MRRQTQFAVVAVESTDHLLSYLSERTWGGWVRRQTQFGGVVDESSDHLLIVVSEWMDVGWVGVKTDSIWWR